MSLKRMGLAVLVLPLLSLVAVPQIGYAKYGSHGCTKCASHGSGDWSLEEKFFHKAHFILENADALGLSEKQIADVKALKMNVKKMIIRQDSEVSITKLDIKAKLYDYPVDAQAIHQLIDRKYEFKKDKSKQLAQAFADLKNGLSAEQYAKMKDIWKKK